MKKLRRKAAFEVINAGMLSFITFVLVVVLTIVLISQIKSTSMVCDANYFNGICYECNNATFPHFNNSDTFCYNSTTSAELNRTSSTQDGTPAYNATLDLQEAANLPPQFAQVIVIVVVIVGILGMLAFVGYGAYQKFKR